MEVAQFNIKAHDLGRLDLGPQEEVGYGSKQLSMTSERVLRNKGINEQQA